MKNGATAKKSFTEIEALIEERIARESEEFDLDSWDIAEIRLETYKANGWDFDPFDEEEEDERRDWDDDWHIPTMSEMLREICMSKGLPLRSPSPSPAEWLGLSLVVSFPLRINPPNPRFDFVYIILCIPVAFTCLLR